MYGLLILNFVIPFVMIFVGYILKKHPVKRYELWQRVQHTFLTKVTRALGLCTKHSA